MPADGRVCSGRAGRGSYSSGLAKHFLWYHQGNKHPFFPDIRSLVCLAVYFINKQAQTKHVCLLPFLDWCDCAIKDPG